MSDFEKARYLPMPALSPYITKDRYEKPKEVFKQALKKVETLVKTERTLDLADMCCANGEFLYFVRTKFPHWNLTGFDFTEEFIQTGRDFKGLSGVRLEVKNLFDIEGSFDIVCCFGSFPIFPDIEAPLEKFLSVCKKGGIIIGDGLFNKFDVEVKTIFCDNSKPETVGIWRADFNQHSRKRIKNFLKHKVKKVEFEDLIMGVDLPFKPENPHSNAFTFRDENGKNIITNGLNLIATSTIMTIRR
jgi:SAM-dependent methyltransferase